MKMENKRLKIPAAFSGAELISNGLKWRGVMERLSSEIETGGEEGPSALKDSIICCQENKNKADFSSAV